jgi:hypothetical protein
MSSSHSHVNFGVYCLRRVLALKGRLPRKVHQALCEKIMKPNTSQDTKWTWLQVAQGPNREGTKLRGPRQKMLKLARQGALSKQQRNWCQGPTCRKWKVLEYTRSGREEAEAELGRNGPILGPVQRPLWPRRPSDYLYSPCQEPHINSIVIHSRGAEKLEGHHLGEEGRASCLGFP